MQSAVRHASPSIHPCKDGACRAGSSSLHVLHLQHDRSRPCSPAAVVQPVSRMQPMSCCRGLRSIAPATLAQLLKGGASNDRAPHQRRPAQNPAAAATPLLPGWNCGVPRKLHVSCGAASCGSRQSCLLRPALVASPSLLRRLRRVHDFDLRGALLLQLGLLRCEAIPQRGQHPAAWRTAHCIVVDTPAARRLVATRSLQGAGH